MDIVKYRYPIFILIFVFIASCSIKMNKPNYLDENSADSSLVIAEPVQEPQPQPQPLGNNYVTGSSVTYTIDGFDFDMVYVEGGYTFPAGYTNGASSYTVPDAYWIGKKEVTYEFWYKVYKWAVDPARGANVYNFAHAGTQGSTGVVGAAPAQVLADQPVTNINQKDMLVWTNALTEFYNSEHGTNYGFVCNVNGVPLRNSASISTCDDVVPNTNLKGFRLHTSEEWELAAKYKGADSSNGAIEFPAGSGIYWTPGTYASGATDYAIMLPNNQNPDLAPTKAVAWFGQAGGNSGGVTHAVGLKNPNALGISDMSGNIGEWCYGTANIVARGGSWWLGPVYSATGATSYTNPNSANAIMGFRLVRSAD